MVAVTLAPGQGNFRAYLGTKRHERERMGTKGNEKARKGTKGHEWEQSGTNGHEWARMGMVWATIYGGTTEGL